MKTVCIFIGAAFVAAFGMYHFFDKFGVSPKEEAAIIQKMGCIPTNEFVGGKYVERLWLCSNGLKYTSGSFNGLAYQDKRAKRGW